jgi:hypothetical protein
VASIQAVQLLEIYVYCSRNPSSGSGLSETGSLDRAKAALERRKKATDEGVVQARVEETRVNPDNLINEILRSTNLEPQDESGTSSITSWKGGVRFISCSNDNAKAASMLKLCIEEGKWK